VRHFSGLSQPKAGKYGSPPFLPDHNSLKAIQKRLCAAGVVSARRSRSRGVSSRQRAVKFGMATEQEKADLEASEKYSVLVNRVNQEKPEWPKKPE